MPATTTFPDLRNEIAGVSVSQLAAEFGTPTYVYDAAKIVERMRDLHRFDAVRFAQKACSNLAIIDLVRRSGGVVDAVSGGEIHRALAAGFSPQGDPPGIVFTADIFDREALDMVLKHDVHVNCGSPDMIDQLGERRPGSHITLRINPGFGHGHSQKTNTGGPQSKHGIWHEQLDDCLQRAERNDIRITGLHMHIGSGTDLEHLAQVCGAMEKACDVVGRSITGISAGGGLPTPYRAEQQYVDLDAYYKLWDAVRNRLAEKFGHAISLEIEPGRYLCAEAGYLIAEIRAIKQMGENTFYLVDAGFNTLARPILYGSYHPMSIAPRDGQTGEREAGGRRRRPALRVGRHLHARGRGLRRPARIARREHRRLPGHRSRRRLRHGDGLELQLQAAARRGAHHRRRREANSRPANARRSPPRRDDLS